MSHESRRRVTRVRRVSNTGILRCTVVEKVHEGILYGSYILVVGYWSVLPQLAAYLIYVTVSVFGYRDVPGAVSGTKGIELSACGGTCHHHLQSRDLS